MITRLRFDIEIGMTKSSVRRTALFISILFASAAALPASVLTPVENVPSILLQISSPSNLLSPQNLTVPSIEGFSVEIRDDPIQRIEMMEMFCNSIFLMIDLAQSPWDDLLPQHSIRMSAEWYTSEIIARVANPSRLVLKYKHVIMGIYELSRHFADAFHFNHDVAYLSVNGRVEGTVSHQDKTPDLVGGQNATANDSSSVQVMQAAYNTSVADRPGVFVDPFDANFVIHYERLGGNRVYIDSLFTAFVVALANASPNDVDELGGRVNSVATDGLSRLVILDASTTGRPLLSWGRCIQAIGQLWRGLIALHLGLETTRFDIEYAGEKLGRGFFKAATPVAGNGTAVARRVKD